MRFVRRDDVRTGRRRTALAAGAGAAALAASLIGLTATAQQKSAAPADAAAPAASSPQAAAPVSPPTLLIQPFRPDQLELVLKTLDEAESHGFAPGAYSTEAARRLLASRDEAERAQGDALLRRVLVAYAKAQHGDRILQVKAPADWALKPPPYDAEAALTAALAENKLGAWLDSLAPPFPVYGQLRMFLTRYGAVAAKGGWAPVADGAALKPGMSDPRVPVLRKRLAVEDSAVNGAEPSPVYDPMLVEAVQRFQARQGFTPDGVVGRATRTALNIPADDRIMQLRANLERWRWLPRDLPATRVDVNIPGAHMTLYRDGKPALDMRAVAGRPGDETPMLQSAIHTIVLNPPWNVPTSIASKELWPKARANPGYLEREGYVVLSTEGGGQRLQQKPGPKNALGRIKFDFDNPFAVYLHDTPNRAAFSRDQRAVSHGCVRLERPMDLAKALFSGNPDWNDQKIAGVLADEETVKAQLAEKTPVFLLYWTAYVDTKGVLNFRPDIYNWDKALLGLLDAGRESA